jgi:replicative DNA helicase
MGDLAQNGRTRGLMTGLRCIDRRLNGLAPGASVVIGGRPGMMKTGLARNIAHGAARLNPNWLFPFLSIEMGPDEMMQRELAALTHEAGEGIEYRAMASGKLTPFDLNAIRVAQRKVPANLILDDCHSLGVDDVRRKIWSLGRRGRVGAVFIDYLQLMRRPPMNGRNEASVISEMTKELKLIARQAQVCVVLLSQLNRSVEQRDDKRPQLSDLRESGSIEQDADAVLFPFREHYYLVKAEPKETETAKHLDWEVKCEDVRHRMDVICAKQRQGPEGVDRQRCFPAYDLVEDDDR